MRFTLQLMTHFSPKISSLADIARKLGQKYPHPTWEIFATFLEHYEKIVDSKGLDKHYYENLFTEFCQCVLKEIHDPTPIEPFHQAIRSPIDYYSIGKEIFRTVVDLKNSTVKGHENIQKITDELKRSENTIFFANHQIEADPQAISILLDDQYGNFAEKMIFIAGERVVTDVLAIPFSIGRNLICIYSKKYFDAHPDRKEDMITHNHKTMLSLGNLLDKGGVSIYIAPSGGRDRPNENGKVIPAKFDSTSIEMMYLLSKKAKVKTHFYPLALSTHHILPPPDTLQINLGESRPTNEASIHLHFGEEIDMENFPGSDTTDKKEKRQNRAIEIYSKVLSMYQLFPGE